GPRSTATAVRDGCHSCAGPAILKSGYEDFGGTRPSPITRDQPQLRQLIEENSMREISIFKKAPLVNGKPDYVVRDLSLAGFGRKEIDLAETEMPGLMA